MSSHHVRHSCPSGSPQRVELQPVESIGVAARAAALAAALAALKPRE